MLMNVEESEIFTAVVIAISILWDITPCSLLKVYRRFGGACGLHLQGRNISQARNQHKAGGKENFTEDRTIKI
jgi:hypothetical protein